MRRRNLTPLLLGLGFAVLMGALALGYLRLVVFTSAAPASGASASSSAEVENLWGIAQTFVLPLLPTAALSWWIAHAGARRVDVLAGVLAGGMAGLLTVLLSVFSVIVVLFLEMNPTTPHGGVSFPFLAVAVFFWPLTSLQGFGADALAVVVGALYGALVRRQLVASQPVAQTATR